MRSKIWTFHCHLLLLLLLLSCAGNAVSARGTPVGILQNQQQQQLKAEASIMPATTTTSPPEGNTTFVEGTTWCVALPGVGLADLQRALDWVCGEGSADCNQVQPGRGCYEPDTILSHASYAFNSYYQQNGNSDIACNFGGTATVTTRNPSYGSCKYPTSETSAAPPLYGISSSSLRWELVGVVLLLFYF